MMTLEQIDSELRGWDDKLRIASDNMLELSDSVGYQRLLGQGHWPKAQLAAAIAFLRLKCWAHILSPWQTNTWMDAAAALTFIPSPQME